MPDGRIELCGASCCCCYFESNALHKRYERGLMSASISGNRKSSLCSQFFLPRLCYCFSTPRGGCWLFNSCIGESWGIYKYNSKLSADAYNIKLSIVLATLRNNKRYTRIIQSLNRNLTVYIYIYWKTLRDSHCARGVIKLAPEI